MLARTLRKRVGEEDTTIICYESTNYERVSSTADPLRPNRS